MLRIKTVSVAACLLVAACGGGAAADVLYLGSGGHPKPTRKQLQATADFHGLSVDAMSILDGSLEGKVLHAIRYSAPLAIVVEADALAFLNAKQFYAVVNTRGFRGPVLITGITEKIVPRVLREWSAGQITGCKRVRLGQGTGIRTVFVAADVTKQLGGITLSVKERDPLYLTLDKRKGVQQLIATEFNGSAFPAFVAAQVDNSKVFFEVATPYLDVPATPDPYGEPVVFANLAPQLIFLHYAAGDRAWHSPAPYANLTIDDPWLREPYGYVNYEHLLAEMNKHNFHTTIAFVPWNYDRSQPAVVSLFRRHSDRYSISMHGNNHDHREFGLYDHTPLAGQVEDVKQGLARMARFSALTGLSYDQVMVFPHSIAPAETLAVLRNYNFLATANSLNVPPDATTPSGAEFAMRTVTTNFSDFPSLRRYSAEAPIPENQLVVDSFLGNPMLFYVHQSFFSRGVGAFDRTADLVNRLQPETQWRSLGYIAKHLYLEKKRNDGNYDVRTYSAAIHLDNSHHRSAEYFIEKKEDFALPFTVFVDGQMYPYERSGTWLRLRLKIPEGASRKIEVKYKNDFNAAGIDISRKSFRIRAIRELSDFRDDRLSRTRLGRWFIQSYTSSGEQWGEVTVVSMCLIALAVIICYVARQRTRYARFKAGDKKPCENCGHGV